MRIRSIQLILSIAFRVNIPTKKSQTGNILGVSRIQIILKKQKITLVYQNQKQKSVYLPLSLAQIKLIFLLLKITFCKHL